MRWLIACLLLSGSVAAQTPASVYQRAAYLDSAVKGTVLHAGVHPHWGADGHSFWYKDYGKDSALSYVVVDETKRTQSTQPAGTYREDVPFRQSPSRWEDPPVDSLSPDKRLRAFIRAGNLYVSDSERVRALTTDGTEAEPYGAWSWSPDSRYLIAYHIHPVETKKVAYILTSLAGTTRGVVKEREYLQPGDSMTTYKMMAFSLEDSTSVPVDNGLIDFNGPPWLHWQQRAASLFTFEKVERGHQRFRILEANVHTGHTRALVDEQTRTFIYENRIYTHYLESTGEIVWS
jgi:hypothetical protein